MHHSVEMIKLKYQKVYETFPGEPFTAYTDNLQSQQMQTIYRYFTPMSSWTSHARRIFFSSSASSHTTPVILSTLKRVTAQTSTLWDDGWRRAELVSVSRGTWYQTVCRSSLWTLVSDRPAVRRRCFDRLTSRSRRATSLGRPRCRDDTRASSDLSPASSHRAHIDDPARSNDYRQLRRRTLGVARRSNDRHSLHVASRCVAVDCVGHPRADEVEACKDYICSEFSLIGDTHVWSFQARQRLCRPAAAALLLKPLAEWRHIFTT